MSFTLVNGNYTLPDKRTKQITKFSIEKLNCPPSLPICIFFLESWWGNSNVAIKNNNWAGMSWASSWKGTSFKRASGVTIEKGTSRGSEGGAYIRYKNIEDFFIDWAYNMRRGGIYKIADTGKNFEQGVKGMFRYGGASYDYATGGGTNSYDRYNAYYTKMKSIRNSINKRNNNILDKLDNRELDGWDDPEIDKPTDQPFPDNIDTIIRDYETLLKSIQNKFNDTQEKLFNKIVEIFTISLYQHNPKLIANKYISVNQVLDNFYLIKPNVLASLELANIIDDNDKSIGDLNLDVGDIGYKDNETIIDDDGNEIITTGNSPVYPTLKNLRISSRYGYRGDIGVAGASKWHLGIDISGRGGTHPIPVYATQNAKVQNILWTSWGGNTIHLNHTSDKYFSLYQHLHSVNPNLKIGDTVKKGQQIGVMGNTGIGSGVHLHFEISTTGRFHKKETSIDPEQYLKMKF